MGKRGGFRGSHVHAGGHAKGHVSALPKAKKGRKGGGSRKGKSPMKLY